VIGTAETVGIGFTVTETELVAEHPLLVAVTVYEVVDAGVATGLAIVVELNPVAGSQL
jgi:hypothetical protein